MTKPTYWIINIIHHLLYILMMLLIITKGEKYPIELFGCTVLVMLFVSKFNKTAHIDVD